MSDTYTYRGGVKLPLNKRADQFVARAAPAALAAAGLPEGERVSSGSTRVTTRAADLEPMMARSRLLGPTHHAYERADSKEEFLITDRVIVSFKDALPPEKIAEIAGRYGLRQVETYSDRDFLFQLTNHSGMNPVKLVVALTENEPAVALVDHDLNVQMKRCAVTLPTDPAYARQWHLHGRFAHPEVDPRAHARVEQAWIGLEGFGSNDVVVGVTDDGCRLDHGDFNSGGKFAGWGGYFQGPRLVRHNDTDALPGSMYLQGEDHGTSCAGVIAGEADGVLTVGAAPGCRLLPVRWELTAQGGLAISDSKMLTMLGWVADKVDVLSNSWGGVPDNNWAATVVSRIRALAVSGGRRGKGLLFLWAAGNENCPIQHTASVDVPFTNGWGRVNGSPQWVGVETARRFSNNLVGVPGVVHVAALASTARRSHYSNHGTGIALCAPSSNSHAYWRINVSGLGVTTAEGAATTGVTENFGGTSSATPLTAGIAALVISANPSLTALEVISILQRTASKDLNMSAYPRTPAANFDPNPSWDICPVAPFTSGAFQNINHADGTWSPWFGHGRVDAAAAVAAALNAANSGGGVTPPLGGSVSSPALAIPDNNPAGVRDTIMVAAAGSLAAIKVPVDITHTFVGDLKLTLIAPSGKTAVLHDRSGGGTKNLKKTFDSANAPSLLALTSEAVTGAWTLIVQDLAAADTGTLNRWELQITAAAEEVVELSEAPGLIIPDNISAGIERTLTATGAGTVGTLEVAVDITHTFIGDLNVTLVSPSGRTVLLHSRAGGGTDNLIAKWVSSSVLTLQTLRGEPCAGPWRLRVSDHDKADTGKLNRWSLRIVKQSGAPVPAALSRPRAAKSAESRPPRKVPAGR